MIGFNWTCLVSSLYDVQKVNKSLRVISLSVDITDDSADLQRCYDDLKRVKLFLKSFH